MGKIQDNNNKIWLDWCKNQDLEPFNKEVRTTEKMYFKFKGGEYKDCTGYTYWASVKRNSVMRLSCLTKDSKVEYVNRIAKSKGLELSGDLNSYKQKSEYKYIGGDYRFLGCKVNISIENLRRLNRVELRNLTEEGKKIYFNNVAENRGYKIIEYPDNLSAKNFCTLESPQGNMWRVSWNSFSTNIKLNCPTDISDTRSYGEITISNILKELGIDYISEKSIKTKSQRHQRLDFYIEYMNNKYAIEYMGKQHYIQSTGSWTTPIEKVQKLDKLKYEYCKDNNIKILYIPYTVIEPEKIKEKIELFLSQ